MEENIFCIIVDLFLSGIAIWFVITMFMGM
jgi:hypothetical protein